MIQTLKADEEIRTLDILLGKGLQNIHNISHSSHFKIIFTSYYSFSAEISARKKLSNFYIFSISLVRYE